MTIIALAHSNQFISAHHVVEVKSHLLMILAKGSPT